MKRDEFYLSPEQAVNCIAHECGCRSCIWNNYKLNRWGNPRIFEASLPTSAPEVIDALLPTELLLTTVFLIRKSGLTRFTNYSFSKII
jgi:hypothetical protein